MPIMVGVFVRAELLRALSRHGVERDIEMSGCALMAISARQRGCHDRGASEQTRPHVLGSMEVLDFGRTIRKAVGLIEARGGCFGAGSGALDKKRPGRRAKANYVAIREGHCFVSSSVMAWRAGKIPRLPYYAKGYSGGNGAASRPPSDEE